MWTLPGPASYLDDVVAAVRSGRSVVLPLPAHGPIDLETAIRRAVGDSWHWLTIDARGTEPPLLQVKKALLEGGLEGQIESVADILRVPGFEGWSVWIDGLDSDSWPQWKSFLAEFEMQSRSISEFARSLFLVPLERAIADDPPKSEVALQVLPWRGRIGEIDSLLYCASRLTKSPLRTLHRRLIAACISRISMWDLGLADQLLAGGAEAALEPWTVLSEIAAARGWGRATPPKWSSGASQLYEGGEECHSAYLAVTDRREELVTRLWAAQAGVLLPAIEQRKRDLLSHVARYVYPPYRTYDGEETDDLADLEVGHILYLLGIAGADAALKRQFRKLKGLRNALAHLEAVSADDALDEVLLG